MKLIIWRGIVSRFYYYILIFCFVFTCYVASIIILSSSSSVAFYCPCMALACLFGFLNLVRHVVGLLWTSNKLVTTQHINTKTNIHAPSGIRILDPSNQAVYTAPPSGPAYDNGGPLKWLSTHGLVISTLYLLLLSCCSSSLSILFSFPDFQQNIAFSVTHSLRYLPLERKGLGVMNVVGGEVSTSTV
jgi:hypothetical protein